MEERSLKSNRNRRPHRKKPAAGSSLLERLNPNAAGIDCGAATHYVAIPADRDPTPVRAFTTFTTDLHRLADWLTACGVTTVAMESTGVYWIPLYEILEARGVAGVLVNARHVKNVPGRKTDVVDCQWIQELHSVGLLRGSFRPTAAIAALRAYLRHRETLVQSAATHVQRMQKALVQMNLQLPIVISDITGVTGLRILRDIVGGQTDPHALAQHRDPVSGLGGRDHGRPHRTLPPRARLRAATEPRALRRLSGAVGGVRCRDRGARPHAGRPSTRAFRPCARPAHAAEAS